MTIAQNLTLIKNRIAAYEIKYGRKQGSVKLLAVSKGQSVKKIKDAYDAKQIAFGENYLQEALNKMSVLADLPLEWHFIGSIQSNKTKKIAEHFSWVQSINQFKIAKRLNDQRPLHLPPLNICLEVNTSHETTKTGINILEVEKLAHACLQLPRLKLRGLMAIPEPSAVFDEQRNNFNQLYKIWERLLAQGFNLDTLSMGMSSDFEAAILEHSTLIRIGTAIFGERD